jgi:hypothetical protein
MGLNGCGAEERLTARELMDMDRFDARVVVGIRSGACAMGMRSAMLMIAAAAALAGGRAAYADGAVVCWGYNEYGQCSTPAGLASVTQIAGGVVHTIALKSDGTVACWGYNSDGQCSTPAALPSVTQIAGGGFHTIAFVCTTPTHSRNSGNLGPIGSGSPREFTFSALPPTSSSVNLTIRVRADLNLAAEFLSVRLDGAVFTTVFGDTGNDCPSTFDEVVLEITAKQFNALINDSALTVRLEGE